MLRLKEMVLIEQSTGSKRSQSKRMAPSKVSLGRSPADILVTGGIIAKKVLVFNFIKMVTNMKACGLLIKNMVKVIIGAMKMANSEESTQEIGSRINNTEEAPFSSKMATVTMDTGSTECLKVKAV
jgi:hypothetical protein